MATPTQPKKRGRPALAGAGLSSRTCRAGRSGLGNLGNPARAAQILAVSWAACTLAGLPVITAGRFVRKSLVRGLAVGGVE